MNKLMSRGGEVMKDDNEEKKLQDDDSNENEELEEIKELGTKVVPNNSERIQVLPIIGQIEGHMVLPPQSCFTPLPYY